VCSRILSIPLGMAALTLRSVPHHIEGAWHIPEVNLTAIVHPQTSAISVDGETGPVERREWPNFHAGVAAGLALAPSVDDIPWLRDSALGTPDAQHAGILLGLGLNGRLKSIGSLQTFRYLGPKHDSTTTGLLLGLSATYVGTCDTGVASILSVYLNALHASNSTSLNLSTLTQAAAMLSVGMLFMGSRRRTLAETALRELSRMYEVPTEVPEGCREAYALSAGLAFGMLFLGSGGQNGTSGDSSMLRTLKRLIEPDGRNLKLDRRSGHNVTDIAITAPAATLALGLAFLDTDRQDAIAVLDLPESPSRLDHIRPNNILLRVLSRNLICRNSIVPSRKWLESQLPAYLRSSPATRLKPATDNEEVMRWHIISGAAFSMGLKFAGTARSDVHASLLPMLDLLMKASGRKGTCHSSIR
jgi:anaphase-promoting complex subunit 1